MQVPVTSTSAVNSSFGSSVSAFSTQAVERALSSSPTSSSRTSTAPSFVSPSTDGASVGPRSSVALSPSSSQTTNEPTTENDDSVVISDEGRSKSLADKRAAVEGEEEAVVRALAARDLEVRVHEQAHSSVGGELAGAASYSFKQGPDGARYAVSGEVSIDVGDVPGDPGATLEKMSRVRRAALAPADPSAQDRQVAAMATQKMTEAQADMANEQREALQADAKLREDKRDEFSAELKLARNQDDTQKATSDREEDKNAFESVADKFAEYNTRLRQINETLLRISSPVQPSAGSLLDDIA